MPADNLEQPAPGAGCSPDTPFLVASHLTKHFPGVVALDDVSLTIASGEVVALVGHNGAGKSTLIQIFAGLHPAGSYQGTIAVGGRHYEPTGVSKAEEAGIALVPQEINVVPDLTVAENILLNHEPTRCGVIDVAERLRRAGKALADFGLDVDPRALMSSLDLATQQLVVIARALAKNARLLILDEPTAALTGQESRRLFDRIRVLKGRGVAIVFVSHRLAEVFAISDRIVVMRDGRIRGRHRISDVSRKDIVVEMVGDEGADAKLHLANKQTESALQVRNLVVHDIHGRVRVTSLDLDLKKGEIVGLFGLLGAGCVEAALAVYGAWTGKSDGAIFVDGVETLIDGPDRAVDLGLGLMAQDRRDCLIGDHSINENIAIASLGKIAPHGLLDVALGRRRAIDQVELLRIKASSIDAEVHTLSGGNQQKVQIARWLAAETRILIMIDPTRGVDVGARSEIKRIWSELAEAGHALLLASTDAEELVDVCHRVIVMSHGRPVGELVGAELTERNLMRMATDG
jgi:ABC-type sugar transport system ATPase subunit